MPIAFAGLLLAYARRHVLVYGPEAHALDLAEPLFGPPVYLRPGYRLFTRSDYLLPVTAIDDIGQRFEPPESYAWIEQRGDLFPRADAVGRLASGEAHSAFLKEVDLTELAVFALPEPDGLPALRVDLMLEAAAVPGPEALTPLPCPAELALFERALRCYRLAPGVFGAAGAAIIGQLLATGRRDWRLTYDEVDDAFDR